MQDPYKLSECTIKKIKPETKDTNTYTLAFLNNSSISEDEFKPGRFILLSIFGFGEAAFSLSSLIQNGAFETTIRKVGNFTQKLHSCKKGDKLYMRGPYGEGWPLDEAKGKDVLLIAGGIGLAPLKPVIMHIAKNRSKYGELEILYGARTPSDMIFTSEFENWRKIPNSILRLTVDAIPKGVKWSYKVGVVPILFEDMETTPDNAIVMTCGPEIMMRFVVKGLTAKGFSEDQIYVSLERRMKCGIAQCGHCQIGKKYVCKDGPVFAYSEIKGSPDLTI
ncbi:MAG: FAD/NAD(P)-binding protein [Candidatus Bathyarchaeia archaeon]